MICDQLHVVQVETLTVPLGLKTHWCDSTWIYVWTPERGLVNVA